MEFRYEIVREIGVLSKHMIRGEARQTEINVVAWNGRAPKFDIREWNEDHSSMSRGITLTGEEIRKLYELIKPYCEKQ